MGAWEYVQNGGFVTSGGYTYYKDGYFGFGTYPGCKRLGEINEQSFKDKHWLVVIESDIVQRVGYKWDNWVKPANDGSVNFESLRDYVEERITVKDYSDPQKNSKICKEYFNLMQEDK